MPSSCHTITVVFPVPLFLLAIDVIIAVSSLIPVGLVIGILPLKLHRCFYSDDAYSWDLTLGTLAQKGLP